MKDRTFVDDGETFHVFGENGCYWKEKVIDLNKEVDELLGGNAETQTEKEPTSGNAVDSDAGNENVAAFSDPWNPPSDPTADW